MKGGTTIEEQLKQRWFILVILYLSFLAFGMTMQSVPPVLSLIVEELHLTYAQAGLLMSFFALPAVIICIPTGMLSDRYSPKLIGVIALACLLSGSAIFASANSLAVLAAGRIIAGIGGAIVLVLSPKLVVQWFAGLEKGRAIGIMNTCMPLSAVLSLNLISIMAQNLGWRSGSWLTAGLSLGGLVCFLALYKSPPHIERSPHAESEKLLSGIKNLGAPIWYVACAWMLFTGAHVAFITFSPDLLQSSGLSISMAGFFTSLSMIPSLIGSPAIGFVIDKTGKSRIWAALGGLMLALFVAWTPFAQGWVPIALLLTGISAAIIPSPIFTIVSEVVKPEKLGLGYGISAAFSNLGILAGPALAGMLRDISGSYLASYYMIAGFAFLVMVCIILSRTGKQDNSKSMRGDSYGL